MEKDGAAFYMRTDVETGEATLWFKQRYGNAGTDRAATDDDIAEFGAEYARFLKEQAACTPLARFRAGVAQAIDALGDLSFESPDTEYPEHFENAGLALSGCNVFADMIDPDYEPPAEMEGDERSQPEEAPSDADETETTETEAKGADTVAAQ